MKLEQIKEIVETVEEETTMSQAMLKLLETKKLDEVTSGKGYRPDPIEKVVSWLEETYDEIKAFVPFKYWNSPVLDKPWLNARRDEIEIRFATGGVFIRLEDFKRFVQHSIEYRYSKDTLNSFESRYEKLSEEDATELGFGSLDDSNPYVKAFKDTKVKMLKEFVFTTARPIEIVDAGTEIILHKLSDEKFRRRCSFYDVREMVKRKNLLLAVDSEGYIEDQSKKVFKLDPRFNFVKVSLLGDFRGMSCDKELNNWSEEENQRKIAEFLAKRNSVNGEAA